MRREDATAVDDAMFVLGHYAALHGPLPDCPLLQEHRTIFYILFVISNSDINFDILTRTTALWTLANLVVGSDLADVAVGHGAIDRLVTVYNQSKIELTQRIPCAFRFLAYRCLPAVLEVPFSVFPGFVEEAPADSTRMREHGLKLLCHFCQKCDGDIPIWDDCLGCFLWVIEHDASDYFWLALIGINYWLLGTPNDDWYERLFASVFADFFFDFALPSVDPDVAIASFRVIGAIFARSVHGIALPIEMLAEKFQLENDDVLTAGAACFAEILTRPRWIEPALAAGILKEFRAAFDLATFGAKEAIWACLTRVSTFGSTAELRKVIESGGVEMLIQGLASRDDGLVLEIIEALGFLAKAGRVITGSMFLEVFDGWQDVEELMDHPNSEVARLAALFLDDESPS
jgi:hypothetical protein